MAKYVANERRARRRRQRKARRMALLATIAIFVLVLSFGVVKVIEHFQHEEPEQSLLVEETPAQQPNTDVDKQGDNYNTFIGPVEQTIDMNIISPEIRMIQVAENGRVTREYFDDAVFMGDSLADGFRAYGAGRLGLDTDSTKFLTRQSLSPSSFTQPNAMIDFGGGPVDPWAAIEQINPGKVYVTIGTNTLNNGAEISTFLDSYNLLVDKIQQYAPNATIYITTITPTAATVQERKPNINIGRIYEANVGLAKMCNQRGLALINLYDVLQSASGYLREDICASDGIHLTPAGYREWMNYLQTHTVYNPNSPYVPGSPYTL